MYFLSWLPDDRIRQDVPWAAGAFLRLKMLVEKLCAPHSCAARGSGTAEFAVIEM